MTSYEERLRHRDAAERATALRERLEAGDGDQPLTRAEALELVDLVEESLRQLRPERWERVMEVIVDEAARRTGVPAL